MFMRVVDTCCGGLFILDCDWCIEWLDCWILDEKLSNMGTD